jgi:hypothetical protein
LDSQARPRNKFGAILVRTGELRLRAADIVVPAPATRAGDARTQLTAYRCY